MGAAILHAVEMFRQTAGSRPLLLDAGLLVLLIAGTRRADRHGPAWYGRAERLGAVLGGIGLCAYGAIALWYARDPHFFDNAEPTLPAVGWLVHLGQPVYPALDAAERYAHIYGPLAFFAQAAILAAFGPSIAASKALGTAAGAGSLLCLFAALRPLASVRRSLALTGICAALLLLFRNYSFWTRPDPLQLLAVSAGLLCAARARGSVAALGVGITSGVLWNLKFTGPLYTLPVLALLWRRSGGLAALGAAAAAASVAAIPFLAFSNVSFANYVAWVRLSARTGIDVALLRHNIEWAAFLVMPAALSGFARPSSATAARETRDVAVALAIGMCGVIVAGAKPGAGPYHLMPFLPVIVHVTAANLRDAGGAFTARPMVPRAGVAFLIAAGLIALAQQVQLVSTMAARHSLHDVEDVERFAATHTESVQMGYGTTEPLSFARPVLVFREGFYLLDQPALREHQLQRMDIPTATIDAITACRATFWLVPKGEQPFSTVNPYPAVAMRPLYPAAFRRAFESSYTRVDSTTYYDVWRCRR